MIFIIILIAVAVQTKPVQNWLVNAATNKLSKEFGTTVSVKSVDFSFFNIHVDNRDKHLFRPRNLDFEVVNAFRNVHKISNVFEFDVRKIIAVACRTARHSSFDIHINRQIWNQMHQSQPRFACHPRL